jgi:hypothetical protein
MDQAPISTVSTDMKSALQSVLDRIEREREREILTRRFGLFERKETLEQIGELLGITRERVRQLEKGTLTKLQSQAHTFPEISEIQAVFQSHLREMGGVARIRHLAGRLAENPTDRDHAQVAFFATLAPEIDVIEENDHYNHGVALAELDASRIREHIDQLVELIQKHNQPAPIGTFSKKADHASEAYTQSLAELSKHLVEFKGRWGHIKWPTVNPKNIRDKIHVILSERKEPLHFSEIAEAIRSSDFKRKDVTVQAIHNELIKDKRFVLIGRGIYALEDWGYKKGTVADIIADVLREEGVPMHRDDIIRRVLEKRHVKQTTILLNLQGKPQFKRVAKATYALAT